MVKRLIYLNKLKMINNISIYNFKDKYKDIPIIAKKLQKKNN